MHALQSGHAELDRTEAEPSMKRTINGSIAGLLGLVLAFTSVGRIAAQETQPAPASFPQSAQPASPTDAAEPTTQNGQTSQPMGDKKDVSSPAPSQSTPAAASVSKGKKGKQEYTDPMMLVELPPHA